MLLLLRAARNFGHPRENHLGQCRIDSQQQRQPNKDNNTSSRWADSQHFKVTSPPTWKSQSLVLWSLPLGELLFQPFSQLHLHYSLIQALEEMELKLPTFWASTFTPRVHKLSNFLPPGFCLWVYLTKRDAHNVLITICNVSTDGDNVSNTTVDLRCATGRRSWKALLSRWHSWGAALFIRKSLSMHNWDKLENFGKCIYFWDTQVFPLFN